LPWPPSVTTHACAPVHCEHEMPFEPQFSDESPFAHEPVSSQQPVQLSELQTCFGGGWLHEGATVNSSPMPTPRTNARFTSKPVLVLISLFPNRGPSGFATGADRTCAASNQGPVTHR
jgi:hypothetical protein